MLSVGITLRNMNIYGHMKSFSLSGKHASGLYWLGKCCPKQTAHVISHHLPKK